jgi:hypothetical protein
MISVDQARILYLLGVGGGRGWAFGFLCRLERTPLCIYRALLKGNDLQIPMEFCMRLYSFLLFLTGSEIGRVRDPRSENHDLGQQQYEEWRVPTTISV